MTKKNNTKEVLVAGLSKPIIDFQRISKVSDEMMVEVLEELKQMACRRILMRKMKTNKNKDL